MRQKVDALHEITRQTRGEGRTLAMGQHAHLEKTVKPSRLGFGMMRLPFLNGDDGQIDASAAQTLVDYAYENGVTYFDTAYPYHRGTSELFIGQALQKYPRESFYLADKLPSWALEAPGDPRRIFEEQLGKCRVDFFDYYLCHNVTAETFEKFERYEAVAYLQKEKRAGRIGRLGFSFHDKPDVLKRIVDAYEWDFVQLQLNYLDWELQDTRSMYELLRARSIPVIVMEPVRGGALATLTEETAARLTALEPHASIASWAVRFAASWPGVQTVLSGMSDMAQVEDNVATLLRGFRPLTESEKDLLIKTGHAFFSAVVVPCTGCRYCMDCPSGVDIPAVFRSANSYALGKNITAARAGYGAIEAAHRAHNCTGCGQCAPRCPQGIDIPARLAEAAETFAKILP